MSLHAQLTPEAQARLAAQRKMSTVSSLIISILSIVLMLLILGFILIQPYFQDTPVIVTYAGNTNPDEQIENRKMTNQIQRTPSAPSSSMAKVIAANTASPLAIPVPEVDVPDPSTDFGSGDDFGDGWGNGGDGAGGSGFGNIPATMRKRCSKEDRLQRLQENGGTPQCEDAVVKALDYLKATQAADGSWSSHKSAMTGLALLAYLGHCETPLSEKYGDTVLKAITFLVNLGVQNNGKLIKKGGEATNSWVYEHGIATYALAEAATFCKQLGVNVPNLNEVTQKAGQFIIDNQHGKSGGWDYKYAEDSPRGGDLSVVAWQIQALKACHHTGMDFRNMRQCISKALEYVEARHGSSGGFSYTGSANGDAKYWNLTGAGMLCLQMWDKESSAPVRNGAKYLRKNSKFKYDAKDHGSDLYCHYYESQAMMNRGGADWDTYNKNFRDEILKAQNADGSFKAQGNPLHSTGDVHYRTCLATLMLEVYYRFLPGTGAGTKR